MGSVTLGITAAIAAADATLDRIDLGTAQTEGRLRIYDGTRPPDPDAAPGGSVLLAEFVLNNPAFQPAVDASPGARATANTITADTSANNTGTATWARWVDRDGNGIIDGFVTGTGLGGDVELDNTAIVVLDTVTITAATYTQPQGVGAV